MSDHADQYSKTFTNDWNYTREDHQDFYKCPENRWIRKLMTHQVERAHNKCHKALQLPSHQV
uniref:Uncharacterized protein n=1 Tax=Romanomermis culicivorax TaxID=13658 RepID=A0A915KRM6_ROMCU